MRALDYLAEQRHIELHADQVRHRYHRRIMPPDLTSVAASLHARTVHREKREFERLDQVLQFVSCNGCQFRGSV